jgi:wobble nucleotide-excising tRNase
VPLDQREALRLETESVSQHCLKEWRVRVPQQDRAQTVSREREDSRTREAMQLDQKLRKQYAAYMKRQHESKVRRLNLSASTLAAIQKAEEEREAARERDFRQFMTQQAADSQKRLRRHWKKNYDANLQLARKAASCLLDTETKKMMDETGLGSNYGMVRFLHKVGKLMAEHSSSGFTAENLVAIRKMSKAQFSQLLRDLEPAPPPPSRDE